MSFTPAAARKLFQKPLDLMQVAQIWRPFTDEFVYAVRLIGPQSEDDPEDDPNLFFTPLVDEDSITRLWVATSSSELEYTPIQEWHVRPSGSVFSDVLDCLGQLELYSLGLTKIDLDGRKSLSERGQALWMMHALRQLSSLESLDLWCPTAADPMYELEKSLLCVPAQSHEGSWLDTMIRVNGFTATTVRSQSIVEPLGGLFIYND